MKTVMDKDHQYICGTYSKLPLCIIRGKGSIIYDDQERKYIDLTSGIGVNTFGFCDDLWNEAVQKQLALYQHSSNYLYSKPCIQLAEMLCDRTNMRKVFFSNSGAEANECAVKAARKYTAERKGDAYYTIITLENSFHGRTITMLSATGQKQYHRHYKPLTPGFISIPADINVLKDAVAAVNAAAVMVECIQGEGGVIALDGAFLQRTEELCKKYDIPLIVDEVQTGNGRTGKLYSYMHYDIHPDIVTTAKGLGGGLPIGATLFGEKLSNVFHSTDHGSTFGGNPLCCAGAINIMERITEELLYAVLEKGKWVKEQLKIAPGIEDLTVMGLMIGFKTNNDPEMVLSKCLKKGVLCLRAKNRIRLLPALNIPFEILQDAIQILMNCCR